jgi:hypothetical protein
MAAKYDPISRYLRNAPDPVSDVYLSVAQMLDMGITPPEAAYKYPGTFWANERDPQRTPSNAWMPTGFRVVAVHMILGPPRLSWVHFQRKKTADAPTRKPPRPPP